MRRGAAVRVNLELLKPPRSRGAPEGAGDLHRGPCLSRPLQGSVWGARTTEGNLVRNPKRAERAVVTAPHQQPCSQDVPGITPCTGTDLGCKTTDSGPCQGPAASRSSSVQSWEHTWFPKCSWKCITKQCVWGEDKPRSLLGKNITTELCTKLGRNLSMLSQTPRNSQSSRVGAEQRCGSITRSISCGLGESVPVSPPEPPGHLLLLVLPRPRRSGAGPAVLPGAGTGTGSSSGRRARLCLGPPSDRLPCEDSEEVDSVQEVYREGIFESERLDFLLGKKGQSCRVPSRLGRDPGPGQL